MKSAKVSEKKIETDATNGIKVVFCDVDNTLVQGASIVHYARALAKRNYFGYTDMLGFIWQQLKFKIAGKENKSDIKNGKEKALAFIEGVKVSDLEKIADELYVESIEQNLWMQTLDLVRKKQMEGFDIWLVTATPKEFADAIVKRLGFDGAIATLSEVKDGVFTGRLVTDIMHGQAKAEAISILASQRNINLEESYAFSDSVHDLPMLSLVGHPVAINPDRELKQVAKQYEWQIYDFRSVRKMAKIGLPALILGTGAAAAFKRSKN